MPFGFGGGPWWLYDDQSYYGRYSGRCFRYPWLPRWWWAGPSNYPATPAPQSNKEQELEMLKSDAQVLKDQLTEIEKRMEELEEK